MRIFETEYKSFHQRLFNLKTFTFLASFIFFTYLILNFKLLTPSQSIITQSLFLLFFIVFIIFESKTNIHKITIDEEKIILEGETFNKKWTKSIDIKETEIILKSIPSRRGICGVIFYLKLKNLKKTYIVNSFETYSDKELLEIFNEFKKLKEEKIILDERLVIYRIQEKIEKCPFQ